MLNYGLNIYLFSFTMKKKISAALLTFLLTSSVIVKAQDTDPYAGIIPAPVSVKKIPGEFILSQETVIQADTPNNKAVQFFSAFLANNMAYNKQVGLRNARVSTTSIYLTSTGTEGLPAEGYRLTITPQQITVAGKGAGLFYGIQTLMQLMPLERSATAKLPAVTIEDYPRFGYRGMMLDVCRHFFSVEFVKRYIDLMAAYKLNTFHWHLTDDQGWRIEIKKYPKLTTVGSRRAESVIGNFKDRTPLQYDGVPVTGFYTQDQIREVIKYASDRYITIVPEIEMPGHALAALTAYPELSCDPSQTYQVSGKWGVFNNIFCPTERTFGFLQDVLTEVIDLFPSKYIHIGGDEAPKDIWKKTKFCQDLIKRLKLKDEHGLQSYFIQRMEKFVNSKGRSIIGWDEILEGGLAPNATVMSWRGEEGGIEAAKQSHDVIMTPSSQGLYFDHAQGKINQEPVGIGGSATIQKTYAYNPTPAALTPDQQKYIKGVQANLWTEYITTENKVEYMVLPRMLALSEVAWTPIANKNYKDFSETRLPAHLAWFDKNGYNFRVPAAIGNADTVMIGSTMTVNLKSPVKGAKIYYTIDGYTPSETELLYTTPMTYPVPLNEYRDLKTIVVTPSGKRSVITAAKVFNKAPLAPVQYAGNTPGLKYQASAGTYVNTTQINPAAVIDTGVAKSFSTALSAFKKAFNKYGVVFNGYLKADVDGNYGFSTASSNGSVLLIDDVAIVDKDGRTGPVEQQGVIPLQKGYHKITIKYVDANSSGSGLRVYMTIPGKPKGEVSPDMMFN
ncbi:family 20 glycosylhydrolase [Mucilaginibacter sp. 5C4]|uniref:family 20 glycosylhydrolase n=3 Tax=Bacteria TaxID=2 RepID=UPI002B23AD1E|nr:family 20 glycosylhydrolase [Mucilaginibacter sp. 5C4]MEB0279435.1 family 20 glycosylhydrolase [Mucilaginibacter sp. 10B2]MEB0299995.1 family 20 glycosylhydrolase [Mucilaginibacter sp. 5C4]